VRWRHGPTGDGDTQPLHQFGAQPCQDLHGGRGEVLAIQRVGQCPARLLLVEQAVLDQSAERMENAGMGAPPAEPGHLAPGERPRGAR